MIDGFIPAASGVVGDPREDEVDSWLLLHGGDFGKKMNPLPTALASLYKTKACENKNEKHGIARTAS